MLKFARRDDDDAITYDRLHMCITNLTVPNLTYLNIFSRGNCLCVFKNYIV
jgi:hypothetical protein